MFLVIDEYSNVYKMNSYKQLKELLIDELIEDSINNRDDKDILTNCIRHLAKIAKNQDINYIEELKDYGWCVKDIMQIHRDIYDLRDYISSKNKNIKCLSETLDLIESELKNNEI